MAAAGYRITHHVINSRCLTPQNRKRVYLVGVRADLEAPDFRFPFVPDLGLRCDWILEPEEAILPSPDSYTLTDAQWDKVRSSPAYCAPRRLAWPDKPASALISHYRVDLLHAQELEHIRTHFNAF